MGLSPGDTVKVVGQVGDDGMVSIGVQVDKVFVPIASREGVYVNALAEAGKSPEAGGGDTGETEGGSK